MDLTTIFIVALCVVTVGILYFGVTYAIKLANGKGVSIDMLLSSSDKLTEFIAGIVKTLDLNPKTKSVLEVITNAALFAVKAAEQLYISGQLDKSKRKDEAVKFVFSALKEEGIEITPEREKIINSIIEAAVFLLPKEVKTDDTATDTPVKSSRKKNS